METQTINLHVTSETGRLRRVVIGLPDTFIMPEPINVKHRIYHKSHPERPRRSLLCPEFAHFREVLESHGVEVHQPLPVPGVPDQLTPRDIGFVVGDEFVIASMSVESRRDEWIGLAHLLKRMPGDRIVHTPDDVSLEGGDVILDKGVLYVGLSERTSRAGAEFLRARYGDIYHVQFVSLKDLRHGEDVLHFDCTFLPVGREHALIYPDGFLEIPDVIREHYTWIEIDRDEQFELATNVLSISETKVIARDVSPSVNDRLRDAGLEVIELTFDETPKSGGSFRCASLPLERDDPH